MDDPAFVAELLRWIRFNPSEALDVRDGLYSECTGNPTLPTWIGQRMFRIAFRKNSENDKYAKHVRSINQPVEVSTWQTGSGSCADAG